MATVANEQSFHSRLARRPVTVWCLWTLVGIALIGLGAEFFAPYGPDWHDSRYLYAPPQRLRFSWRDGLHVLALRPQFDAMTRRWSYEPDPDQVVPIRFIVHREPSLLLGAFVVRWSLFGADEGSSHGRPFFLLGSDGMGRDVYSRLVFGTRISLGLAFGAVAVMMLIGVGVGSLSGYLGGHVDGLLQRSIEIINSFPHLPIILGLSAALPRDWSVLQTYLAISVILTLLGWTGIARVVRGKVMALREEEYVMAARLLGAGSRRILWLHILPGLYGHLAVSATLAIPATILGETALSFLGLGLRDPVASWGVMIQECVSFETMEHHPWLFAPVLAVVATVVICNFLGEGLREAVDPQSQQ